MDKKEEKVKDLKTSLLGIGNGIIGSNAYQIIVFFIVVIITTIAFKSVNSNATEEQVNAFLEGNNLLINLVSSVISGFITILVFYFILKKDTIKKIVKSIFNMKALKYGVLVTIAIIAFSFAYNSLLINIGGFSADGNANESTVTSLVKENLILGFLMIVIIAPFSEEITYRYCLFGEISKRKKWLAYLASGIVFMFMHSISSFGEAGGFNKELLKEFAYLPPYLFSGLALCYAYDKTGLLGTSVVAHLINNLISFVSVACLL